MTCLVAVEHALGVVVGCDSYLGDDEGRIAIAGPKWWRVGALLLAHAGGFRAAQVAEHSTKFRSQKRSETDERYLVTVVANGIAAAHRELEVPAKDRDGSFLVAHRGRAWLIQDDYSVLRSSHGYVALGDAELVALGALAATEDCTPRERVERALRSAALHSQAACEPFHYAEQGTS